MKFISLIIPNVLRAIEYTKFFKNFEDQKRDLLAFNIRRALAVQIILIINTIGLAVQKPNLAFYERKLQLQKSDMMQIIGEVLQVSPSSMNTDSYLRTELARLGELVAGSKAVHSPAEP